MKITFRKKIENISLQVGDTAYFVTPNATGFATSSPKLIGKIDKVRDYNIVTDNVTNTPSTDDFIMFFVVTVLLQRNVLSISIIT